MNKAILLLLLPLALSAQVEVDTVIDLGVRAYHGFYIQELNKLYVRTPDGFIALDCSTWQSTAIPAELRTTSVAFAYSPVQRKLYAGWSLGWYVIDVLADTIIRPLQLDASHMTYVPRRDQMYLGGVGMKVLDCATDSVIKRIYSPVPGTAMMQFPSYDPIADRIYVVVSRFQAPPPPRFAVYDSTDSLLKVFPPDGLSSLPGWLVFCHKYRKAYYSVSSYGGGLDHSPGVVDTDRMELITAFPFDAVPNGDETHPVGLNLRNDKAYLSILEGPKANLLYVLDCKTDSVLRKVPVSSIWGMYGLYWVPWSNRIYASGSIDQCLVLDSENDSILIENLVLPGRHWAPYHLQFDTIRERIFAFGADTNAVHVLRDLPYGVKEDREPTVYRQWPMPTIVRGVLNLTGLGHNPDSRGGIGLCPAPVLLDITGRKVMELVPGENDVRHLSPGVYFVRATSLSAYGHAQAGVTRNASSVHRVVIQR